MNGELFAGFEREISLLKEKISNARAALEEIQDGEESAIARFDIRTAEELLEAVIKSRNTVLAAETNAEERPRKFRAWRANVAKTREAKLIFDALASPIEVAQTRLATARQNFHNAEFTLADFRNHPIANRDYEKPAICRKWDERCIELEKIVEERGAILRTLNAEVQKLQGEYLRAQKNLDDCAFRERMSKLPDTEKPMVGAGSVSRIA